MKKLVMTFIVLSSLPAWAEKGSGNSLYKTFAVSASPFISSAITSTCTLANSCDPKIVAAKEDAAQFVASEGEFVGPQLLQAFETYRTLNPAGPDLSDLEIAIEILNY